MLCIHTTEIINTYLNKILQFQFLCYVWDDKSISNKIHKKMDSVKTIIYVNNIMFYELHDITFVN
jgi:hypothetical protein